jgi:V8-like Glu-specific endopeptidase
MHDTHLDVIRNLAEQDALERSVELLLAYTRGRRTDGLLDATPVNRAINISGRLAGLRRERADGSISREENQVERNRIRIALLSILDDLSRLSLPPRPSTPNSSALPFSAPSEISTNEAIFGIRQLRSVGWLRRGLDRARAVCRVSYPAGGAMMGVGTAFHIGGGYLLTNHHVLPTMSDADAATALFDYEEDATGGVKPGKRYRTVKGSWRSSEALDCAVVRIDGADIETWGKLDLELAELPREGDHVTIIQHPEAGPMQIAMTANQICKVQGHQILYTTDTLPGSSGSPVFNDHWRVVAIHVGEATAVKNTHGEMLFANAGNLVAHVVKALGLTLT